MTEEEIQTDSQMPEPEAGTETPAESAGRKWLKREWFTREWLKGNYWRATFFFGVVSLAGSLVFAVVVIAGHDSGYERKDIEQASLSGDQKATIQMSEDQVPTFMTGEITPPVPGTTPEAVIAFFDANKSLYRMENPAQELVLVKQGQDTIGMTHVFMGQVYQGVPVYGHEMAVHYSPQGTITSVDGNYKPGLNMATEPGISAEEALAKAKADLGHEAVTPESMPPQLIVYAPPHKEPRLAWRLAMASENPYTRMLYFIDAQNGQVLDRFDKSSNQ